MSVATARVVPIRQQGKWLTPVGGKKKLQGKICLTPYISVNIHLDGSVALCGCTAWQPSIVGNIFHETLPEILSNQFSTAIRGSIAQGTYDYCDDRKCGLIASNNLNTRDNTPPRVLEILDDPNRWIMPYDITLAGDETCNLSCPSCRRQVKINSPGEAQRNEEIGAKLTRAIFCGSSDHDMRLHVSTTGELFASPMLLRFVNDIPVENFPNLRLSIQTNGLLAPDRWHRLGRMQDRVSSITVTMDAARPATYERLRRGGKWADILGAMQWLQNKKTENGMKFNNRMVVQRDNYQEMLEFYELSQAFNVDTVEYCRLLDFGGVMGPGGFKNGDVFDHTHPEFELAKQELLKIAHLPNIHCMNGIHIDQIS